MKFYLDEIINNFSLTWNQDKLDLFLSYLAWKFGFILMLWTFSCVHHVGESYRGCSDHKAIRFFFFLVYDLEWKTKRLFDYYHTDILKKILIVFVYLCFFRFNWYLCHFGFHVMCPLLSSPSKSYKIFGWGSVIGHISQILCQAFDLWSCVCRKKALFFSYLLTENTTS